MRLLQHADRAFEALPPRKIIVLDETAALWNPAAKTTLDSVMMQATEAVRGKYATAAVTENGWVMQSSFLKWLSHVPVSQVSQHG